MMNVPACQWNKYVFLFGCKIDFNQFLLQGFYSLKIASTVNQFFLILRKVISFQLIFRFGQRLQNLFHCVVQIQTAAFEVGNSFTISPEWKLGKYLIILFFLAGSKQFLTFFPAHCEKVFRQVIIIRYIQQIGVCINRCNNSCRSIDGHSFSCFTAV